LPGKFGWWMEISRSEKSGSKSVFWEVGIGDISGGVKISELESSVTAVRSGEKRLTLVHCPSRSDFGGLLAAKFSKYFYRGS